MAEKSYLCKQLLKYFKYCTSQGSRNSILAPKGVWLMQPWWDYLSANSLWLLHCQGSFWLCCTSYYAALCLQITGILPQVFPKNGHNPNGCQSQQTSPQQSMFYMSRENPGPHENRVINPDYKIHEKLWYHEEAQIQNFGSVQEI